MPEFKDELLIINNTEHTKNRPIRTQLIPHTPLTENTREKKLNHINKDLKYFLGELVLLIIFIVSFLA